MSARDVAHHSNGPGTVAVVPPATCAQNGTADPVFLNAPGTPAEVHRPIVDQSQICTCEAPVCSCCSRRLAKDIARVTGENAIQIQHLIDPTRPKPPLSRDPMTETEAIERLRALNECPERIGEIPLKALERAEKKLADENLKNAPARYIAAGMFDDLGKGLFGNQLSCKVCIGRSTYNNNKGAAQTDPLCARGIRITLSEQYYDEYLRYHTSPDMRMWDATTSLIHEMCHAYLRALCGWPQMDDVEYLGSSIRNGHGVYFGQVTRLVQNVLDYRGWNVDLSEGGRYPMYSLRPVGKCALRGERPDGVTITRAKD